MNKKNCTKHIHLNPIIRNKVNRIIVIGDIHGDFKVLTKCLKKVNLIDDNLNWIGKDTYVVQMGDQLDSLRGLSLGTDKPNDILIINYMTKLNEQAVKSGGAVYSLIGNHEVMNVEGDFRYTSFNNIDLFDKQNIALAIKKRRDFFKRGESFAKYMGCTRHGIVVIGSNIFCHAGLIFKYDINKMNNDLKNWLIDENFKNADYIINTEASFLWTRDYDNSFYNSYQVTDILSHYNKKHNLTLKRMFIGHNVQENGINSICNGQIWRVDTGMSSAFDINNKKYQVVEIFDNDNIKIIDI